MPDTPGKLSSSAQSPHPEDSCAKVLELKVFLPHYAVPQASCLPVFFGWNSCQLFLTPSSIPFCVHIPVYSCMPATEKTPVGQRVKNLWTASLICAVEKVWQRCFIGIVMTIRWDKNESAWLGVWHAAGAKKVYFCVLNQRLPVTAQTGQKLLPAPEFLFRSSVIALTHLAQSPVAESGVSWVGAEEARRAEPVPQGRRSRDQWTRALSGCRGCVGCRGCAGLSH